MCNQLPSPLSKKPLLKLPFFLIKTESISSPPLLPPPHPHPPSSPTPSSAPSASSPPLPSPPPPHPLLLPIHPPPADPIIAIGVFLLIVSLCGLAGACCRNSLLLLWIYLLVMFLLILLFCFTVFAFVVTNKGADEVVFGRGYKEYRLGDYSNWLQKRVESSKIGGRLGAIWLIARFAKSLRRIAT